MASGRCHSGVTQPWPQALLIPCVPHSLRGHGAEGTAGVSEPLWVLVLCLGVPRDGDMGHGMFLERAISRISSLAAEVTVAGGERCSGCTWSHYLCRILVPSGLWQQQAAGSGAEGGSQV